MYNIKRSPWGLRRRSCSLNNDEVLPLSWPTQHKSSRYAATETALHHILSTCGNDSGGKEEKATWVDHEKGTAKRKIKNEGGTAYPNQLVRPWAEFLWGEACLSRELRLLWALCTRHMRDHEKKRLLERTVWKDRKCGRRISPHSLT